MKSTKHSPVRYAVVGSGHIAQAAILPAFAHAGENSKLVAIVSGDEVKRHGLKQKYGVPTHTYQQYDHLLSSGDVDAVFIALPNHLHADYAIRAAEQGVHILCEKPMAVTEEECRKMIRAAEKNKVKLMVAYRLHFEEGNMEAVRVARSGELGEPVFFSSEFSIFVKDDNYRVEPSEGGGTLYDLGVYCINAARYLFRSEPIEVTAFSIKDGYRHFHGIDETTSALLRFSDGRLAQFTTSFGAADTSAYMLAGTKGVLRLDPAYEYVGQRSMTLIVGEKGTQKAFGPVDQFAPEIVYFSNCIIKNQDPEPSGEEGLRDVRIVEALYESARSEKVIKLEPLPPAKKRPDVDQIMKKPPVKKPELIHAAPGSR